MRTAGSGWPHSLERQLAARLRRRQRLISNLLLEQLAHLPRHDAEDPEPTPAWLALFAARIRRLAEQIRAALDRVAPVTPASLSALARSIDAFVTSRLTTSVLVSSGVDLSPLVVAPIPSLPWAIETAGKIRAMESATIERALQAAASAAESGTDVVRAARHSLVTAPARAAAVAQGAVGALAARVGAARGISAGKPSFVWRTQQDDRVRDAHVALEGTVHLWSDPGPDQGMFPGEPANCRCWAEPV